MWVAAGYPYVVGVVSLWPPLLQAGGWRCGRELQAALHKN